MWTRARDVRNALHVRSLLAVTIAASALRLVAPAALPCQDAATLGAPRSADAYDVVRIRPTTKSPWILGTVVAVAGDTLMVALHSSARATAPTRIVLDTISAIERRVVVPGSRTMAAAEGLYWGAIAGGVIGWLSGVTYGAVAGGTTPWEGGERGVVIGASALGAAGAITLGVRHMRGDNGPESVRVEWVPIPVSTRIDRSP